MPTKSVFDPVSILKNADGSMQDHNLCPITIALLAPQGSGKTHATMWLLGQLYPHRRWDTLLYLCSDVTYDSPANPLLREHVRREQVIDHDWDLGRILDEAKDRFQQRGDRTVLVSTPPPPLLLSLFTFSLVSRNLFAW
jgi:hypothetical protein